MNEKIFEALTSLAKKLGTTAEHLWGVLLRQARVEFLVDTFLTIILIVASIVTYKTWKKIETRFKTDGDEWEGDSWERDHFAWAVVLGISALLLAMLWIARICTLGEWFAEGFNPEYWALKEVLGALGGTK